MFSMMSQQSLDELCFATSAADSTTLAPLSVGCRVAAPVGVCESAEPPSPQPDNRPAARKQPTATANISSETAARLLRPSMSFAYPRRQELYRSLNSSECIRPGPRMSRRVDLSARGCVCPGLSTGPSGFSAWNGKRDSNPRPPAYHAEGRVLPSRYGWNFGTPQTLRTTIRCPGCSSGRTVRLWDISRFGR